MGNYLDTYEKADCNGCGVCALKCPKHAISMEEDLEGFYYPVIRKDECVECGICRKVCSNNPVEAGSGQQTYIAVNPNMSDRKRSASGGIFYAIAKFILGGGGTVFGVTVSDDLTVLHEAAGDLEDAKKFQGSKYVRSRLNDTYQNVEKLLKAGGYVLFTGTPCQCSGLYSYLGGDMPNLLTCEIICHANPSPKVFRHYVKNLEINAGAKVKEVLFRSKENGWKNQTSIIVFEDGRRLEDSVYYQAFVNELINRPSCHNCVFSGETRYADLTIGDFWGIERIAPDMAEDDLGVSLLNVNTEKGRKILGKIEQDLIRMPVDTKTAFSYNHHCNVKEHKNRAEFFRGISSGDINEENVIYYMKKYMKMPFYRKVINKAVRILRRDS